MDDVKRPMINDALRLLRLYRGLSQKQLSEVVEISQSMISEIEKGVKPVSMEVLAKYSSSLGIRMSQLLFFAEELRDEPVRIKGKLIIASGVLSLLDKVSPQETSDAP